ncbi:DUF6338 family protein [Saccharothrix syringae]|uniref:Uncharacterized protein n=1 Tax=Saccharothrix syringae TaxID=103733 RepID=A0A5Q0H1D3_SACSY|nr:DUF6338 family protein [Saccharothrix syringae]QFZ19580.1 hypothetical protein EKG83_20995 [Saccharothrix syringae]
MIATFQGLLVALLALLPGASYTFAYERVAGSYGISFSDRLIRFLASSALLHAVFAAPEHLLYRYLVVEKRLQNGTVTWWLLEVVALTYVLLPTAVGSLVGWGHKTHKKWAVALVGDAPEPRAWDYLWRHAVQAIVLIRLKSGTWLAGYFGRTPDGRYSYAAGHPEEGDLYLALAFVVDQATGELTLDRENKPTPVPGERGLLVRWAEIEYIDIKEYRT